ncbi:hypothetical protein SS50377_28350 [Spironucleus salmonicida]|uniref:PPi-type phosphoenolpyruvate carboxykinase lobe 2 domain-containing protein n=2 Tax=Spironucleus salmonicida TaxID=348837 RepID=A0A9P8LLR9_9EUKA|nr:hypothetical protein SS50377_28347 [Spironucleus salmonicida]KAH0570371.1 hypothetical protein SS50377_28350 [Spironucleus salmonicida]
MELSESLFNHYSQKQAHHILEAKLGLVKGDLSQNKDLIHEYINLKLLTLGQKPIISGESVIMTPGGSKQRIEVSVAQIAQDLIQQLKASPERMAPVDERITSFLTKEFPKASLKLPAGGETFSIDRAGVAFELSTPHDSQYYSADGNLNIRIPQGLLSNPKSDKRSTVGTFHVGESSTSIPFDKLAVPKHTVEFMLKSALNPPKKSLELPFTASLPESDRTHCWTSVYCCPPVIPGIGSQSKAYTQKHMDVRYFAPAAFVANLGFVEQIFSNRGNPTVNDLLTTQPELHSGVSAIIILAPHLVSTKKKECGLPHFDQATERQKRDGMCWKDENELYNGGKPFKLTYRSQTDGVVVSILADTYFGYSKKEIKTMISFACNIRGFSQEEHAGGCYTCPAYSWGRSFRSSDSRVGLYNNAQHVESVSDFTAKKTKEQSERTLTHTFAEMKELLGGKATYDQQKGYLIDKSFKNVIYLPEYVNIELSDRNVTYKHPDTNETLTMKISSETVYVLPNGYQMQLQRHPVTKQWMIVGTLPTTKFLYKPSSVSGSGKSELSKSIMDAVTSGPFFCKNFKDMMDGAEKVLTGNFNQRFRPEFQDQYKSKSGMSRHILAAERTIGSVIQLLTIQEKYTEDYNKWLSSFDQDIIAFIFVLKSMYRPSWGDYEDSKSWRAHFSIDVVNGSEGYALKCQGVEIQSNYLRVGMENGNWRKFRLRQDFFPGVRFQNNDDIAVSLTIPGEQLNNLTHSGQFCTDRSYKLTSNCEYRYFQRPDDAVHPGVDKKCENDLSETQGRTFISNFEPIPREQVQEIAQDVMTLEKYSTSMQNFIKDFSSSEKFGEFDNCVISSEFRITDPAKGTRTANVRYLQTRDELLYRDVQLDKYMIEIRNRLARNIPFSAPVPLPVDVYVPGRRLNTVDPKNSKIRPLSVYNPVHYQPIPLLILDVMTSMSGKSPSTTGSGSLEGALTKGPFNNLLPALDINYFALSLMLSTDPVLSTAAGNIGRKLKIDHDITLIIPDIVSRMTSSELNIDNLIAGGFLEKVKDFEHKGQKVPASILGYRITQSFVRTYFSRIFDHVGGIFTEEHLRPELQSIDEFADGVMFIWENICGQVSDYYKDGSFEQLIPPLQTLLQIVQNGGTYNNLTVDSPEFLAEFKRANVINSPWYKQRLIQAQRNEIQLLQDKISKVGGADLKERLEYVRSEKYLQDINGSLGVHVFNEEE